MSSSIPVVIIYDDMGHLITKNEPPWFRFELCNYRDWLSGGLAYIGNSTVTGMINRRAYKDPFYLLKTRYGPVILDLSALPYEPKRPKGCKIPRI